MYLLPFPSGISERLQYDYSLVGQSNRQPSSSSPKTMAIQCLHWWSGSVACSPRPTPFLPPCLLFADDILLLPSSHVIAKRMLSVVATWSVRNGISVNLPKCGVILPTTSSLTLSLWIIPYQSSKNIHTYVCLSRPLVLTSNPTFHHYALLLWNSFLHRPRTAAVGLLSYD